MSTNGSITALQFTEQMSGYVALGQNSYQRGYEEGRLAGQRLRFELTIRTDDVKKFCDDREHVAGATGYVEAHFIGGRRPVESGTFNLFVSSSLDLNRKKMVYRLFFSDADGNPLTLSGNKDVHDDVGADVWRDTTTLFVYVLRGHIAPEEEARAEVAAAGILSIHLPDLLKMLTTVRTFGPTADARSAGLNRFGKYFLGSLWTTYGPANLVPQANEYEREIPMFTTEGVRDVDITIHPYSTGDKLGLSMTRFCRKPCKDAVIILHGLTTLTDMYIMPEHYNLVSYLLDNGLTDVWTIDYRMSNRFPYNLHRHRYTMDDVALYDYPPALAEIRLLAPDANIHVICHCLGSVSFMMSLFGKTVSGIKSVISNSVSLTPRVPRWSRIKSIFAPFLSEYVLGLAYLNPRWSEEPGLTVGKVFTKITSFFHHECNVPACHMLSLMWGTGWPALYNHQNMADVTHRRGGDLYGPTSVHYYRHVRKMVGTGAAVKYDPSNPKHAALPNNYFQYAAEIQTPVLFVTGGENRVFTDSNIETFHRLESMVPGRHRLKVFPTYGHQDIFMGKDCARDIFPTFVEFIKEQGATPPSARTKN